MRLTIPAISGRIVQTMVLSPPGPSGMSIRATNEVYGAFRSCFSRCWSSTSKGMTKPMYALVIV